MTDPSGNFEILALPIGNYSVAVTAQGFKTWALAKMELTVGERSRISPMLQVGDVSEQVSVESSGRAAANRIERRTDRNSNAANSRTALEPAESGRAREPCSGHALSWVGRP